MGLHANLLVIAVCCHLLFHNRVQCRWDINKTEGLETERQVKSLNELRVKTIATRSYAAYGKTSAGNSSYVGSATRNDFISERHSLEARHTDTTNRPGTYLAIARTKASGNKYFGAGCYMSTHKLELSGKQFSTTRIRLLSGSDSIEAGWRVDPSRYVGDYGSRSHFFVRTDAGGSHCFNDLCPGFVHVNLPFLFSGYIDKLSKPGGPIYDISVRIIQDYINGTWFLIVDDHTVGHWLPRIFGHAADYIEWGAAAYAPPGSPLPPMGFGNFPTGDLKHDAYLKNLEIKNEKNQTVDPYDLETFSTDSSLYIVRDAGNSGPNTGRVIVYGGSGHRKE